ncbi:hypothetical protein [Streptomyces sp. NPDC018000]|uniref:hypothetical protein n=1 Tax=Streptomyces sp. NPDC018000 TaxID=3365028 RepID=UPI0037B41A94
MADSQFSSPPSAPAGAPASGVIHVRTRLTAHFTVIANARAQRPGSAVTVGVAAYILSLPDRARVSVAALCDHFTEGEILISRALRELESAGYLERRRVRGPGGLIRTQTYFYDVPGQGDWPTPPPPRPRKPTGDGEAGPTAEAAPEAASDSATGFGAASASDGHDSCDSREACPVDAAPELPPPANAGPAGGTAAPAGLVAPPPLPLDDADPQAVAILASLRIVDRRLVLSRREVATLAPAITEWVVQGIGAQEITRALTLDLPCSLRSRPARILAYRLREQPVAVPTTPVPPDQLDVLPWQTCDGGCERAFRAARPGSCGDCRDGEDRTDSEVGIDSEGRTDGGGSTGVDSVETVRAALLSRRHRSARTA